MYKSKKEVFLITGFLIVALFMQIPVEIHNPLYDAIYNILILVIYLSMVTLWRASVQRRVLHKMMKMHADGIVFFMIIWIIARTLRFTVFFQFEPWERVCWYMYYIPMIWIPMFCFMSARCMGKSEEWKPEKAFYIMYIPAVLMTLGIMTNDIHQWAFKLCVGETYMLEVYGRGWLYYGIVIWSTILAVAMVLNLLSKFRVPQTRQLLWIPIGSLMLGLIWSLVYITIQVGGFVEFSIISCVVIITAWESCIWTGLMPSNMYYEEMFYLSNVSALIIDDKNKVRYAGKDAIAISEDMMNQAKKELIYLDQNTRLRCVPISGGHVLWTEDVSTVNGMLTELFEIGQNLEESNDLLTAEITLKEKKAKIDEKNRLYDNIARDVQRQLDYIRNMLKDMTPTDEFLDIKFAIIVIMGAYIKRRTNLFLLKEKSNMIPAEELYYCIRESVECMRGCNIVCSFESYISGMLDADIMILIYNVFQRTIEKALLDVKCLLVTLKEENHYIALKMVVEDYRELLPADYCKEEIKKYKGALNVEEIDGAEYVVLYIPKGGVKR